MIAKIQQQGRKRSRILVAHNVSTVKKQRDMDTGARFIGHSLLTSETPANEILPFKFRVDFSSLIYLFR